MNGFLIVKITLSVVIILFSGLICGMLGMLIGVYLGGNLATNFQFFGVRGYEATGQIGFIIGAVLGAIVSWKRIENKWKNTNS
jgi:hypothetical protein